MALTRTVPSSLLDSLFSDPFFSTSFRPAGAAVHQGGPTVQRSDGRVIITLDVPGLRAEDLDLSVTAEGDGAVVTVQGERQDARGTRSVRWSARLSGVDADAVTGDLTDGVLTIVAPEHAAPVARRVELTSGAAAALDVASEPAEATAQAPEESRDAEPGNQAS